MIKIDLHTHSFASSDGGLRLAHYEAMLLRGVIDYIAITDHNRIDAALEIYRSLGDRIIVGEEISTTQGDLIGLYLTNRIPPGLSARETAERIHAQGGLVYAPHPFDHIRKALGRHTLTQLDGLIDILEIYNGRLLGRRSNDAAKTWATTHGLPGATSSDAHGWHGWGKTYTTIVAPPTCATLSTLLANARHHTTRPGVQALLYPKANRLRKWLASRSQHAWMTKA